MSNVEMWIDALSFDATGHLLACVGTNRIALIDPTTGSLRAAHTQNHTTRTTTFVGSGPRLAVAGGKVVRSPDGHGQASRAQGELQLLDVPDWRLVSRLEFPGEVLSVSSSRDGGLLAVGDATGQATVWSTLDWTKIAAFQRSSAVRSISLSADGRYVAVGGEDRATAVWQLTTRTNRLVGL
jgi:WD40 repeat protein